MGFFEIFQIIFGGIVLLFLPGFVWSYVLFKEREIDFIERIILSFGLSIALVPLTVFILNYTLDVQINLVNFLIGSVLWIIIPLVCLYLGKLLKKTRAQIFSMTTRNINVLRLRQNDGESSEWKKEFEIWASRKIKC